MGAFVTLSRWFIDEEMNTVDKQKKNSNKQQGIKKGHQNNF